MAKYFARPAVAMGDGDWKHVKSAAPDQRHPLVNTIKVGKRRRAQRRKVSLKAAVECHGHSPRSTKIHHQKHLHRLKYLTEDFIVEVKSVSHLNYT